MAPCSVTQPKSVIITLDGTEVLFTCELLANGSLLVHGLGDGASKVGGGLVRHDDGSFVVEMKLVCLCRRDEMFV